MAIYALDRTRLASRFVVPTTGFLRVGGRVIDLGAHRFVGGVPGRKLTPKAVAVLVALAREQGRTLTQDELLDRVWAGTCPTIDVVRQVIRELRRAFDEDVAAPRYIETIAKVGYRLIAECEFLDVPPDARSTVQSGPDGERSPQRRGGRVPGRGEAIVGAELYPRLSPDGTCVVYAASTGAHRFDIRMLDLEDSSTVVLASHAEGSASFPAWSPGGAEIAFYHWTQEHCWIVVSPIGGGPERSYEVCASGDPAHLEWFPDGRALLLSHRVDPASMIYRLYRLDLQSGRLAPYGDQDPGCTADQAPRFSPDGRWIAIKHGSMLAADLWLLPVAGTGAAARRLTHVQSSIRGHAWLPDGQGLVFSSYHLGHYALYLVDLDDPQPKSLNLSDAAYPAVRRDGTLLYQRIHKQLALRELFQAPQPASGARLLLPDASSGSDMCPMFSPDGRYLAFLSTRSGREQVWILDRQDGTSFQLTDFAGGDVKAPAWDFTGHRVMIPVRETDGSALYEVDVRRRTTRLLLRDRLFIDSAAFGSVETERWIAVGDAGATRLARLVLPDATAHASAVSVHTSETAARGLQTRGGDSGVYFREDSDGDLCRYDPDTHGRQRLALPFRPWQWRVSAGGIEILRRLDNGDIDVWHYDLRARIARHVSGPHANARQTVPAPGYLLAGRDPKSGRWIGPMVSRLQDDIAITKLDALAIRN